MTNRQIVQHLTFSERTVGVHASHVLTKLQGRHAHSRRVHGASLTFAPGARLGEVAQWAPSPWKGWE